MQPEETDLLSSQEAAARLGVRLDTLYAYVSRGRITRVRTPSGSRFDPLEVERFAAARRPSGHRMTSTPTAEAIPGRPLTILETDLARIDGDTLEFRGVPVDELSTKQLEEVAWWLWTRQWPERSPVPQFRVDPIAGPVARAVVAAMPRGASGPQLLAAAVAAIGASDPTLGDLDPGAVARRAATLLTEAVSALPLLGPQATGGESDVAAQLWSRLTSAPADHGLVSALRTALVTMVDHDLAVSTLAARAAASARADIYGVVLAGLGALDSPLHGQASAAAHQLLAEIGRGGSPEAALASAVRASGSVPGFGHFLYRGPDPRALVVLGALRETPQAAPVLRAVDDLSSLVLDRTGRHPNIDMALAALTLTMDADPGAGEAVFAVGRMVGWVAHAMDEYTRRPLRLRPTGRYVGP